MTMTEQLKELIEKIQQEGVRVAEDKAAAIEAEARRQAEDIIKGARKEAEGMILSAQDKAARQEASTQASLKQVSRDVLLALKSEINAMLNRLITARLGEVLTPAELASLLSVLIKEAGVHAKADVVVALKKEDAEKLEKGFLGELKKHVQANVTLKASDDIRGGFTISYDAGKSLFDFTDKALAEYIIRVLKPKLADILLSHP
jgi:V/A-type H+-transporting ATPase subunit E